MSIRRRRRRFGGLLVTWRGGFQWQWPHLVVHVGWTRHRMPVRR